MGRADRLELGTWNALCDRCQKKYKAYELRREWTGWMVCDTCWEPRHPQDFLKGKPDNSNVPWTRPDQDSDTTEYVGDAGKTITFGTNESIQNWNTELTNSRVVILKTGNAKAGDRITIYKTVDSDNSLIITSTQRDSGTTV
jgi:hypothetical protein